MHFSKNKAIYTQISDYLCEKILKNTWHEAEKIPSIREMAVSLEVNPNTVVRAYATLEQAGIIEMKRGIGYFVMANANAKAKIIAIKKEVFLGEALPDVFNAMDLLNIELDEFVTFYQERKNHEKK
jgi:GntR family transcriptional regulator